MVFLVNDLKVKITVSDLQTRVDLALMQALEKHGKPSRTSLKGLFKEKQVRLLTPEKREIPLTAAEVLLKGEYEIILVGWEKFKEIHLNKKARPCPQGCFLPIVYEDSDLLILNKNTGV